jgi:nucleoside-diphosphate-sugar epimerase
VPGIGPKTADRLAELGLRTIGQLQQADEALLAARFGAKTARFLRARAHFEDDSPVETERGAAKSRSNERTFDTDIADHAELESVLRALAGEPAVDHVTGIARRQPRQPLAHGDWARADVARDDLAPLFRGADVVVHLAWAIQPSRRRDTLWRTNVLGSGRVFAAAADAQVPALVYASSVGAYGAGPTDDRPVDESWPTTGIQSSFYARHKAEVERVLAQALAGGETQAYVFRPCIVAGPEAPALINAIPHLGLRRRLPGILRPLPVLPDPGVPFQLVHHDDVALALRAAILGEGRPGVYNLAAAGQVRMSDVARELGWRTIPVPGAAVAGASAVVARLRFLPAGLSWVHALRVPSIMDTATARRELGWQPRHDAHDTLRETVACARKAGIVD